MKRLPLISEKNEKKIAKDICKSIAEQLSSYYSTHNDPGILNGLGGISCFFFHFSDFSDEEVYRKHAYLCLEKIIQTIEDGFEDPSFGTGLAGIHWIFRYLGEKGFISNEEAGTLSGLETLYLSFAKECFNRADYDYLHGGLGMAMTGLNEELCGLITSKLYSSSKPDPNNSIFWECRDFNGNSEINLGLSHGIPSILLILSKIYQQQSDPGILENQIVPGMKFMIDQMNKPPGSGSAFPSRIKNGIPQRPSRMAWCYGDPGAATAIYQVGANCSRPDWEELAIQILLQGTIRKSFIDTKVEDACLCHGSSGLAVIYYNAWLKTGRKEFYEASRYWVQATLNYAGQDGKFLFKGLDGFEVNHNLLEGIAGVGLSLLAFMEGELPGWEKALMVR